MTTFYEFQPTLADLVQSGFIARQLEEGLDTEFAYRRHATEEMIGGRLGSTIILSKIGRKGPVVQPLNPANLANNLDNGLTPSLPGSEQYQYQLMEWGDSEDVDLIASEVACADLVIAASRTNGVQAAQSMERLAKIQLFTSYNGGNTYVRKDLSGTSTTAIHVDDTRGFAQVMVNGVMVPVSTGNPLPCVEVATSSAGFNQTFNVTGVTLDSPNVSLYPGSSVDSNGNVISDGLSGILTIVITSSGPQTPAGGDAIIAANAAKVVRPFNKPATTQLNLGDVCTLGVLQDALTRLASNAVPRFSDGTYHFICDYAVMRQLFADQQFMVAYASRYKSDEMQSAQIFELLGITFIPTTEAYVQPPTPAAGINVPVRRSIMLGAESLLQGNFSGLETYANHQGMDPFIYPVMVNNVAQIIRPPLDRMGRILSLTWTFISSWTCPTDSTATPLIIPTASNAIFKRAVVIETAG